MASRPVRPRRPGGRGIGRCLGLRRGLRVDGLALGHGFGGGLGRGLGGSIDGRHGVGPRLGRGFGRFARGRAQSLGRAALGQQRFRRRCQDHRFRGPDRFFPSLPGNEGDHPRHGRRRNGRQHGEGAAGIGIAADQENVVQQHLHKGTRRRAPGDQGRTARLDPHDIEAGKNGLGPRLGLGGRRALPGIAAGSPGALPCLRHGRLVRRDDRCVVLRRPEQAGIGKVSGPGQAESRHGGQHAARKSCCSPTCHRIPFSRYSSLHRLSKLSKPAMQGQSDEESLSDNNPLFCLRLLRIP